MNEHKIWMTEVRGPARTRQVRSTCTCGWAQYDVTFDAATLACSAHVTNQSGGGRHG